MSPPRCFPTVMRWGNRCASTARTSRSRACWPRRAAAASARPTIGVIVPLSTAQRKLFGGRAISGGSALLSSIAVQAKDSDSVTAATERDHPNPARPARAGGRWHRRRFQRDQSAGSARQRRVDHADADAVPGRDRGDLAAGGRDRHYEHHAGVGARAHARDRAAQGARRARGRHSDPVP